MINKRIITILTLILLMMAGSALTRAAELEYPEIEKGATTTVTGYVTYIYTFSIMIAGIIVFAVLIYAGFRYLTSAGNPAVMKSAKRQMLGAFLGLILLLTSYLILNTINPDLVKLPWGFKEEPEFKPKHGICFYNEKGEKLCFVKSSKTFPKDFEAKSVEFMSPSDELVDIHIFSQKGWKGTDKTYLNHKGDAGFEDEYKKNISFSPKSFFIYWREAGVFLFKKKGFKLDFPNEPYKLYRTSASDLESYNNQVKSILLRPLCSNGVLDVAFGAVLHSEVNFEGTSTVVLLKEGVDPCKYKFHRVGDLNSRLIGYGSHSITVFKHSYKGNNKGSVTFYDRSFFQGDYFKVTSGTIGSYWHINFKNNYPVKGSVKGAKIKKGKGALDNKEIDRIMSLKIEGNYLVVLGSTISQDPTKDKDFESPSEVIFQSDPNLNTNYVLGKARKYSEGPAPAPEYAKIQSISIIPLQEPIAKP